MRVLVWVILLLTVAIVGMAASLQVTWNPSERANSYWIYYVLPDDPDWISLERNQKGHRGARVLTTYTGLYHNSMSVLEGTVGIIPLTVPGPVSIYVTAVNTHGESLPSKVVSTYYKGN